jgi:arylsulfatase A-like enzyme
MMRATFRAVVLSFLLVSMFACTTQAADRPNVLMIAIDDLNDWVSCLGGHPQAKSPHIDRLAKRGVLFTNAHCQAPICNPSRTSLMLGMRPSTTGIYVNRPWFRTTPNNKTRVTLSQYFAEHGYRTLTTGKIYHGSRVDGPSFQTVGPRPGQRLKIDKQIVTDTGSSSRLWDFGPQQYEEEKFSDFVDASWAIEKLQIKRQKPFFLAVGFYRPHVPWYAPQRFFDDRPRTAVKLPVVRDDDRDDLPTGAVQLTTNPRPPSHKWFVETDHWKDAVQSYLACVSFTDAQVGRLLDALDKSPYADNTIIVLFSDHGFHLGEKQRWAKQSLWESSTRVPMIISVPGGKQGERCSRPVELLHLYPTLLELCGLPARDGLEGTSLGPLLKDSQAAWSRPAITTYKRNNHAVRSEHWRYIRYTDGTEELYDHRHDPHEWMNLAAQEKYQSVIAEHAKWLPKTNVPEATPLGQKKK